MCPLSGALIHTHTQNGLVGNVRAINSIIYIIFYNTLGQYGWSYAEALVCESSAVPMSYTYT